MEPYRVGFHMLLANLVQDVYMVQMVILIQEMVLV